MTLMAHHLCQGALLSRVRVGCEGGMRQIDTVGLTVVETRIMWFRSNRDEGGDYCLLDAIVGLLAVRYTLFWKGDAEWPRARTVQWGCNSSRIVSG